MIYFQAQQIAKQTLLYLKCQIKAGINLQELRQMAENKMLQLGATSFWYWNIGAFIFSGTSTSLSISGRHYKTQNCIVKENDIITIDLSPQIGKIWGDYARTVVVENGAIVNDINRIHNDEWRNGLKMEDILHNELIRFAKPKMTFDELYRYMNSFIINNGYLNLDFIGNLGHSIEKDKRKRIYIEKGNKSTLDSVKYFTFEPHIAIKGSQYGYKKEDIYYFDNGTLVDL